jgi:hypothetical protein
MPRCKGLLRKSRGERETKKSADRSRRPFVAHRIEAYGILVSPDVGDSVVGWFTVTFTPF